MMLMVVVLLRIFNTLSNIVVKTAENDSVGSMLLLPKMLSGVHTDTLFASNSIS